MKRIGRKMVVGVVFLLLLIANSAFAQEDKKGCRDHPMFTRMPNFYITYCEENDFSQVEFVDEKREEIKVEGKFHLAEYHIKEGFTPPTDLQILRNFQNAIKKIGGLVVYENLGSNFGTTYLKLSKSGKTWWAIVSSHGGEKYELTVVEKAEMVQKIVADAKSFMSDIQVTGHASVYGIYFDFNKADIKSESEPVIKEIAKLLQENKGLKLYVVGHTDNVGSIDYNMKLSKARADAVINDLVTKYKVSPDRLKSYGVGSLAPVASNKTEEGRAKNRRVELVEQ